MRDEVGVQSNMRPKTQTTAAPNTAKPINFNPAPTGSVSVTGVGGLGGGGSLSEQEAQANTAPNEGRSISLRDQRAVTRDRTVDRE